MFVLKQLITIRGTGLRGRFGFTAIYYLRSKVGGTGSRDRTRPGIYKYHTSHATVLVKQNGLSVSLKLVDKAHA
jgi:hypothetical protein